MSKRFNEDFIDDLCDDIINELGYYGGDVNMNFDTGSKTTDNFLKRYGDYKIVKLMVARSPVEKELVTFLDLISLGTFKKDYEKKYDILFHLYLVLQLEKNGDVINVLTEKRPNIEWDKRAKFDTREHNISHSKIDTLDLTPSKKDIQIQDVVLKAKQDMGHNFENYDAINNCQKYINSLVKSVYSLSNAPYAGQIKNFINQDVEEILNSHGLVHKVANTVTGLAHSFNKTFLGKGRKKCRCKHI